MNYIEINSLHGGNMYNLFYITAFLTMIALFIISGLRYKYSFQRLWLIAATGAFFFILGNKFFAIPPQDWKYLITGSDFINHGAKTMLGGLIGLIAGSILVIRWLKLDSRVADFAAIGLPLSMAVTRVGCLAAGCCFGKPAELPWAIRYPAGYHAFKSQLANGLIHENDAFCLPVHPAQLYDIISCLLIALIIWKAGKFLNAKGNRLLFAIFLYGCARFIIEFFRDPASDFYAAETWLGVKYIQWILIGAVILIGLVIWYRERKSKDQAIDGFPDKQWTRRPVTLLVFLVLVHYLLFNWFDALEKTTIGLMLIPSIGMMAWSLTGKFLVPGYRFLTSLVILSCMLFMSQTYIPKDPETKVRFFEVGAGALFGRYYTETAQKLYSPPYPGGTGCNGEEIPPSAGYYYLGNFQERTHLFQLYGINASYHVRTGLYKRMATGLNSFYGFEEERYSTYDTATGSYIYHNKKYPAYAVNPYISFDLKNIGLDIGFHYGSFRVYNKNNGPTFDNPENSIPKMHFYPQFGLRIGPQHILYLDARYCNAFPTCFPLNQYSIGLASGLGTWNGTKIAAGYSSVGVYTSATIVIKEKYLLELLLANNFADRNCISVGLHYRLGYKEITGNKK